MLFPKFAEGLEAVLFIALNSGAGPVSSKQICAYQHVLPRHLEPLLQILVKEGILKGTKGPRGGYSMAREKRKVTIAEIFTLLSKEPANKIKSSKPTITTIKNHVISHINREISKTINTYTLSLTVEDLCKQLEANITTGSKADFAI